MAGRTSSLTRLVVGFSAGYFALWACAPTSTVAPMVPLHDQTGWDIGGAVSAGATTTVENVYENVPTDTGMTYEFVREERHIAPAGGAQVWGVSDLGRVDLGLTMGAAVVGGVGGGPHGGFIVRPHLVETDDLVLGLDLQLGWLWGSLGLPVSVRASDRVWVYTDPSLGFRYSGVVNVPVGLSVEVGEHMRVNAELNYLSGNELGAMGYLENGLFMSSVGLSYRP